MVQRIHSKYHQQCNSSHLSYLVELWDLHESPRRIMGTTFASNYSHLIIIFLFVMFETPYWENTHPHKKKNLHPTSIWRLIYQLVFKPLLGKISRSFKSLAGKGVSSPLASSIFACKSCLHSLFKTSRIVLIPPSCESNLRWNVVRKQFAAIKEY